ncbi:MAG TPA: alpha/beta hydrolase [Ktedonobacterales bacterium]
MQTRTNTSIHSTASGQVAYSTGFVTSKDGTRIGYRQLGHGPGVVVLHGAMESAASHMELAEAMADRFTVYLPDRRGRGMSGAPGPHYRMQTEVDDLDALLRATDTQSVFGVSAGALILLQAALELPAIRKAGVFEPPLTSANSALTAWMARYDREMARGDVAAAMVTGMLGAEMGPAAMRAMPRWLLESLTNMMMKSEDKKGAGDLLPMRTLAPTLHYDGALILEMEGTLERFRAIRAETLLLGGSKSPAYLRGAVAALEPVIPGARRVEFAGLDHGASGPSNRGGKPQLVAEELVRFFA